MQGNTGGCGPSNECLACERRGLLTEAGLLVRPGRGGGRALDEGGGVSAHGGVGGGARGTGSGRRTKGDWDSDHTGTHSGDGRMLNKRRAIFWLLDVLTVARAQPQHLPSSSLPPRPPRPPQASPPGPASTPCSLVRDLLVVPTARQLPSAIAKANMSGRVQKQSMSELKLRRLTEHNQRLREDLARPRIRVSEASRRYAPAHSLLPPTPGPHPGVCHSLINYCKSTPDHLVSTSPDIVYHFMLLETWAVQRCCISCWSHSRNRVG